MKNYLISAFIFVCAAGLCLAGCGKKAGRAEVNEGIPVKTMVIKNTSISHNIEYVGDIKGKDEAIVYPKASGKIVEQVKREGDAVKKGDAIFFVDRDEVGLKFEKAPVDSPLDGFVGRIYIDIGSSVTPQTAVALVTNTSELEVDLLIPEKYIPKLKLGLSVSIEVDAYPDEVFTGVIREISPVIDIGTRSVPIEIKVDDKERRLQSGMFAKTIITLEEHKNVPVIPKECILGKAPEQYVYVVREGKAWSRNIKTGLRNGPYYEITEGLAQGDKVVIIGQQRLRDAAVVIEDNYNENAAEKENKK